MNELSAKGRMTLTIFLVAAILLVPFFSITKGILTEIDDKSQEIEVLQAKIDEIDSKRSLLDAVKAEAAKSEKDRDDAIPITTPLFKSYEVHYLFSNLVIGAGLSHQSLAVSDMAPMDNVLITSAHIEKFDNRDIGLTPELKIELDTPGNMIPHSRNISFTVKGSFDDIMKVCDEIRDYSEYITIDSLNVPSIDKPDETGRLNAAFVVTVYLISKA